MRSLVVLILVAASLSGFAQTQHLNLNKKRMALKGYDPVAYFNGKAEPGKKEYFTTHSGARYRFVSETNKDEFLGDPEKYLPQYGGWCAYAMATSGDKVNIDPNTFEILEGRLYLFFNESGTNTLKSWKDEDPVSLIKKAEKNWGKINK